MKNMKMIEPDFWMGKGRYSKKAMRDAAVDNSPIEKSGEPAQAVEDSTGTEG